MREYKDDKETTDHSESFDVKKLEAELTRDFRISFYLSQGEVSCQSKIMEALSLVYAKLLDSEAQCQVFDTVIPNFYETHVQPMRRLPPYHIEASDDAIAGEFQRQCERFIDDITFALTEEHTVGEFEERVYEIGKDIIKRDIEYLTTRKRNEQGCRDIRTSLFREHVLLGEPTTSHHIDYILNEVRSQFENNRFERLLYPLKINWERWHPNESFFPEQ